ncbi:hypothetical protein FA95DRAFT_1482207 [Auriscalpium vulgare]|uniref:Uncharacterized protein n=1 Tax=Auriscalpium vulgare TaxID=40419 RepID=A0ACB8SBF2_9AGAM|nr:hypothetical protein FA95DRAFT_1482207 [Auriscalpium vulgare]
MLARTRTEPIPDGASGSGSTASVISISSTSSPKRVGSRTDTLIDLTSSATASAMSSMTSEDQGPRPGPSTLVAPQPSIRTYAGKSRSFLVPLPSGPSGLAGGLADDDLGLEVRESYTDLRTRWGVDNSEDDPRPVSPYGSDSSPEHPGRKSKGKERASKVVLAPGMMNDLKSITELRSKGESRRFMDEVGYLFEGMDEGASIGVRRSSALEIVTKLCDVDFARRAKATDFLTRAWDVLRGAGAGDGDKILDAILVLFAACAAESPQDLLELVQLPDFVPTLWRVLPSVERAKDALQLVQSGLGDFELKKAGISKAEKIMLRSLFSIIVNKSGLAPTDACPALRQLLTQALAKVPPSLHQPSAFVTLHKSLIAELSLVPSRLVAYDAGLPLIPDPAPPGFAQEAPELAHIEACLVILDAFLLGRWAESDERPSLCDDVVNGEKQEELIDGLMSLCVACNAMLRGSADDDLFDMADKCLESTLRVLINLSHENTVWCRHLLRRELTLPVLMSLLTVAQRQSQSAAMEVNEKKPVLDLAGEGIIDDDTDQQAKAFDRLCLALGLLTNLVQVDDDAKDLCRATRLSPSCPGSRSCFRTCRCTSRINALDALVGVYLHYRKSDADHDEAAATIVRGHLAILFGLLMRGSAPNTRAVLDALPGVTRRAKLDGLLSNAREFVGVYAEFMVRVARGEGAGRKDREDEDEEEREREEERHRDERAVRDGASEGVARDVIGFLESLRDE